LEGEVYQKPVSGFDQPWPDPGWSRTARSAGLRIDAARRWNNRSW